MSEWETLIISLSKPKCNRAFWFLFSLGAKYIYPALFYGHTNDKRFHLVNAFNNPPRFNTNWNFDWKFWNEVKQVQKFLFTKLRSKFQHLDEDCDMFCTWSFTATSKGQLGWYLYSTVEYFHCFNLALVCTFYLLSKPFRQINKH